MPPKMDNLEKLAT